MSRVKCIAVILSLISVSTFVSGCATTLSNKGAFVRVTNQAEEVKNCK